MSLWKWTFFQRIQNFNWLWAITYHVYFVKSIVCSCVQSRTGFKSILHIVFNPNMDKVSGFPNLCKTTSPFKKSQVVYNKTILHCICYCKPPDIFLKKQEGVLDKLGKPKGSGAKTSLSTLWNLYHWCTTLSKSCPACKLNVYYFVLQLNLSGRLI